MFTSTKRKRATFSSLPIEIRQQIYLEALPDERRVIGLDIIGLTAGFPQVCWWGNIQVAYLIGARLYAAAPDYDGLGTCCTDAWNHFIQPAETQMTISALAQLERASRWVTTRIFPHLLCLQISRLPDLGNPYDSDPHLQYCRRLSRWRYSGWRNILPCSMGSMKFPQKPQEKRQSRALVVRCSFERDIFFVNNFRKIVTADISDFTQALPATRVQPPGPLSPEAWVNGLEAIRKLQRVAAYRGLERERRWVDFGIARNIFDELLSLQEITIMGHTWEDFVTQEEVFVELQGSPLHSPSHHDLESPGEVPAEPPLSLFAEPRQPKRLCCRGEDSNFFCFACHHMKACKQLMLGNTTLDGFREWTWIMLRQLDMWMEKNPSNRHCAICGDPQHEQLLKHRIGRINEYQVESGLTVTLSSRNEGRVVEERSKL